MNTMTLPFEGVGSSGRQGSKWGRRIEDRAKGRMRCRGGGRCRSGRCGGVASLEAVAAAHGGVVVKR
ncbi:hypothetical protein U1Q18_032060 [Sarracenia purpurea var. burkii]